MRIIAVLLAVVLSSSAVLAVKPEKAGPSVEETLKYINERLYSLQDYSDRKCSETVRVSLSENRDAIIVLHLVIDRDGRIKDDLPPKYAYRVPVAWIRGVYSWGRWTTQDRIVIRTQGSMVTKYGPVWDCGHNRLNDSPKKRFLGSVDLKLQEPDDSHLSGVDKAVNHLVKLLQADLDAKSASPPKKIPDADKPDPIPDPN